MTKGSAFRMERKITLTCHLTEDVDDMLIESARNNGRTRRTEAELRLEDHLRRFTLIPVKQQFVEKESGD
ncbi:TraY domain-containing protein [Escherichia coli]|uniref:TraY domain-containing protein n=1 Tax=Escherichia coli TaxID=562 RepID=UPI00111E8A52|nr:TraY domain-containing protein [Escherichia coli]EIY1064816.1 TraY domain-containing protein [Escherichia coli]EKR7626148.1 TraY domain-containing protein [Escherichia coli]TPD02078.1 TraY domain-containing protein [Escherichia coli]